MKLQKLLTGVLTLTLMMSCATTLTREDVSKKVEQARDANEKAQEKTIEAIEARNQFTSDYKETEIKKIDKRIKSIDKQMKSIGKSAKNDENETVSNSLNTAVDALKEERKTLTTIRKEIESIKSKNWQENIAEVDSVMNVIKNNLLEVESSLDKLSKK